MNEGKTNDEKGRNKEMKKDMKKFIFLFAAFMLVMWGVKAQAAFKWNADASQTFTARAHYDLSNDHNNPTATRGDILASVGQGSGEWEHFFSTLLGINGTWELVKDTSFNFRVASQFDWLGANTSGPLQSSTPGDSNGANNPFGGTNPFSLWINQIHLDFMDFAGFPVNFKLGRQNIWLGKGFVLGNRLFGAGPTIYAGGMAPTGSFNLSPNGQAGAANYGNLPLNSIAGGSLNAPETSDYTGFDAAVANVHLLNNKLNFDFGYVLVSSALTESAAGANNGGAGTTNNRRDIGANDNETLWFLNAGYKEKTWNTEAYVLFNHDKEPLGDRNVNTTAHISSDQIITYGTRGDFDWGQDLWWFKHVNTFAEFALQMGRLGSQETVAQVGRKRNATAFNMGSDFHFSTSYSPSFGLEGVYFSGQDPTSIQRTNANGAGSAPATLVAPNNRWTAWDPQFRGRFFTKIMDFIDDVYLSDTTNKTGSATSTDTTGRVDAGFTNRLMILARTGFEPMKKTSFGLTYAYAIAAKAPQAGAQKAMGQEIDWDLGYQLSNVTSWFFDGGFFLPGSYYTMLSSIAGGSDAKGKSNAMLFRTGFKLNLG